MPILTAAIGASGTARHLAHEEANLHDGFTQLKYVRRLDAYIHVVENPLARAVYVPELCTREHVWVGMRHRSQATIGTVYATEDAHIPGVITNGEEARKA